MIIKTPKLFVMYWVLSSDLCSILYLMHTSAASGLGCSHLLSRGSLILEGTWWRTLPPLASSDFLFLSLTRSLALSSHTACLTTQGFSLQETLPAAVCWVALNETHSKDVFAVALRAIPATWRSLWLLFFEAWSACLSNLEIKPGARSMPGSWRERPGEDGLHLSGERWCKIDVLLRHERGRVLLTCASQIRLDSKII